MKLSHWIAALGLGFSLPAIGSAASYTIAELTPPTTGIDPGAINASGQVVFSHADNGYISNGNTVTTIPSPIAGSLFPGGLNDVGQVVGFTRPFGLQPQDHAFIYSGGTVTDLNSLIAAPPGTVFRTASGINNAGQIIGDVFFTNPARVDGFLYSGGVMTDLGPGEARAINNNGDVIAGLGLYSGGVIHDLGSLGGPLVSPWGLNASDQVVGYASLDQLNTIQHAFLSVDGVMQDLGVLPGATASHAWGINDSGVIVGDLASNLGSHASIYQNGSWTDLNSVISPSSGWILTIARGINDTGQIAGIGFLNGSSRGFILTPTPEPSSLALAALGFAGLACWQWRRRNRHVFN